MIERAIGDYEVVSRLGAGGMGAVYRARHRALGVDRALKVVLLEGQPERLLRFEREAQHLARVEHPNVVRVHEAGLDGARSFLVMDLVEGPSLDQVLARGRLPLDRALALAVGLARGLAALHAAGVVHRDLKPENVVVRADGAPVIVDLGLAVAPERDERLTRSGVLLGTPLYMAPEQLLGRRAGPPSDVFALGLLLFELTSGVRAIPPMDSLVTLIAEVTERPRPSVASIDPALPAWLGALIAQTLAIEPARRPTAQEVLAALERQTAPRPRVAPARGRAAAAWGLGGATLVVALVAAWPAPPERPIDVASPAPVHSAPDERPSVEPDPEPDPEAARQLRRIERDADPASRLRALEGWLARWPADPEAARARELLRRARVVVPVELSAAPRTRHACFLDERRVVTGGAGGVELWDAASGARLERLTDVPCGDGLVAVDARRLLLADRRILRLIEVLPEGGASVRAERRLAEVVISLATAASGRRAIAGLAVGEAVVLELEGLEVAATLGGHEHPVYAVALSDDGQLAATGTGEQSADNTDDSVRLWSVRGERARVLRRDLVNTRVSAVAFLPGSRGLLVADTDGHLCAFSVDPARFGPVAAFVSAETAQSELGVLMAHPGRITGLVRSRDGRRAWSVSSGDDAERQCVLIAWDVDGGRERCTVALGGRGARSVDVSPDGARLVTAGLGAPALWSTD